MKVDFWETGGKSVARILTMTMLFIDIKFYFIDPVWFEFESIYIVLYPDQTRLSCFILIEKNKQCSLDINGHFRAFLQNWDHKYFFCFFMLKSNSFWVNQKGTGLVCVCLNVTQFLVCLTWICQKWGLSFHLFPFLCSFSVQFQCNS